MKIKNLIFLSPILIGWMHFARSFADFYVLGLTLLLFLSSVILGFSSAGTGLWTEDRKQLRAKSVLDTNIYNNNKKLVNTASKICHNYKEEKRRKKNSSLAAPGALAHPLHHLQNPK